MGSEILISELKRFQTSQEREKILRAHQFSDEAHKGVKRQSGEPYVYHPIRVAVNLIQLGADADTVCAALLHDVPEDTPYTLADVREDFGHTVAELVDGVTKISKLKHSGSVEQRQVDSMRKMFLLMSRDLRVIFIKLADRLDNMRTLDSLAPEKRKRIASETLEVYAPLANLLGMWCYKRELEDLCFKVLFPQSYEETFELYNPNEPTRTQYISDMSKKLLGAAEQVGIKCSVAPRFKGLYGIFLKKRDKDRKFNDCYDVFTLVVIVPTQAACYEMVGLIHKIWKPSRGLFKDYISVPKANGYQSLHTTVFGSHGFMTEFQIRTPDMDLVARCGITSEVFSHSHNGDSQFRHHKWIKTLLEVQNDEHSYDRVMRDLKADIFQDRIFVYTPKGELIDLPHGATPLDFAYSVHTDLGHRCERVKINNNFVPISTILSAGDVVEIILSESPKGPDIKWLNFVKTNVARKRIQEWLRRETDERKILIGEEQLRKEFRRAGFSYRLSGKRKASATNFFEKQSFRDLLLAIAEGEISSRDVVQHVFSQRELKLPDNTDLITQFFDLFRKKKIDSKKKYRVGLLVRALDKYGGLMGILESFRKRSINMQEVSSIGWGKKFFNCYLYFDIENIDDFNDICEELETLEGVVSIETIAPWRKYLFYFFGLITLVFWLFHPIIVNYFLTDLGYQDTALNNMIYIGIIPLFLTLFLFRDTVKRSFPDIHQSFGYWFIAFFLNSIALGVVIYEILTYDAKVNLFLIILSIAVVYTVLLMDVLTSLRTHR